jgi:hypothetical protein
MFVGVQGSLARLAQPTATLPLVFVPQLGQGLRRAANTTAPSPSLRMGVERIVRLKRTRERPAYNSNARYFVPKIGLNTYGSIGLNPIA